jgi:hypothetical protein
VRRQVDSVERAVPGSVIILALGEAGEVRPESRMRCSIAELKKVRSSSKFGTSRGGSIHTVLLERSHAFVKPGARARETDAHGRVDQLVREELGVVRRFFTNDHVLRIRVEKAARRAHSQTRVIPQ